MITVFSPGSDMTASSPHGFTFHDQPTQWPPDDDLPIAGQWQCDHTWTAHSTWIRSIAVSPCGHIVATGSGDRSVKLWQTDTHTLIHTLQGHEGWVRSVAFSPDGQFLASVGSDFTLCVWQVATGRLYQSWKAHQAWIGAVAFHPDGQTIATGSQDKTVKLWQIDRPDPVRILTGHDHWVRSVAFSANGRYLASGSRDRTLRVWQVETGACAPPLPSEQSDILAIAFDPHDPRNLISTAADGTVDLWHWHKQVRVGGWKAHEQQAINTVKFDPLRHTVITGGNDKTVQVWSPRSGQCLATLTGHPGWVWSVDISADGRLLASADWTGVVKLWQCVT